MSNQPISVISEYKKLGLDFRALLSDVNTLDKLLSEAEKEKNEVEKTLEATQLCFNRNPNSEYRQLLNQANGETLKAKYRLAMLKILKLLSQNCESYEECKEKRKKILDLLEYRKSYLEGLGIRILIDPFDRTKVKEQSNAILSMTDNSKVINGIRKEIAGLTSRIEEMTSQNSEYLITLSDTRKLIESNVGLGDIDITSVELPFEEPFIQIVQREIAENQVVGVRDISSTLQRNMPIVLQKTSGVVRRCAKMINGSVVKKVEHTEEVVPELVIVPSTLEEPKTEIVSDTFVPKFKEPEVSLFELDIPEMIDDYSDELEDEFDDALASEVDENQAQEFPSIVEDTLDVNSTGIFETVTPFEDPSMFMDRTDEALFELPNDHVPKLKIVDSKREDTELSFNDSEMTMPEAFWVTHENQTRDSENEKKRSFEEQIRDLMDFESSGKTDSKVRKKVA